MANASRSARMLREIGGAVRNPARLWSATGATVRDGLRRYTEQAHLYRYASRTEDTRAALDRVMQWVRAAQRPDGGNAAYYSLLTGWSASYPETTGYLVPTVHDYAAHANRPSDRELAATMTSWLLGLQHEAGSFPGGVGAAGGAPSVFNTGQILQGLVRAGVEGDAAAGQAAIRAGDWLASVQDAGGPWQRSTYKDLPHTYYTMVAWSLAYLSAEMGSERHADAARANLDWVVGQGPEGLIAGINLPGELNHLHFVAYVLQGLVEAGRLLGHGEAVAAAEEGARRLLRTFEVKKRLPGALDTAWKAAGPRYACLTGNAQMSAVWLRLYELSGDMRWLNAALKINELLKEHVPRRGRAGIRGGVPGSAPVWGPYQPYRYINWGAKFTADAFLMELRAIEPVRGES